MFVISKFSRRKAGHVIACDLLRAVLKVKSLEAMRRRLNHTFSGWLA